MVDAQKRKKEETTRQKYISASATQGGHKLNVGIVMAQRDGRPCSRI